MNKFAAKVCLFLPILILLGGCDQTYTWVKTGASNSEFYKAKSYCQSLASGATPMDYSNQGSSTTYYSGTVSDSGGSYVTYYGTPTNYDSNTGKAFANLGQPITRQNLFNDCMRGKGWSPVEETAYDSREYFHSKPIPPTGKSKEARPARLPFNLHRLPLKSRRSEGPISRPGFYEILGETEKYYKIRSPSGLTGWILKGFYPVTADMPKKEAEFLRR